MMNSFLDDDTPRGIQHFQIEREVVARNAHDFLQHNGIKAEIVEHTWRADDGEDFSSYSVISFCTYTQMRKAFSYGIMECSESDYDMAQNRLTEQEGFGLSEYPYIVIEKFPPDTDDEEKY